MSKSHSELLKELREVTQAGMKDCKDALEEVGWDLQKAVDIVKVKGLNVVSGRAGRIAADGRVDIAMNDSLAVMIEVNCQTDFVANSKEFSRFVHNAKHALYDKVVSGQLFSADDVEQERKEVVSLTKENVVVRRWWAEEATSSTAKVFAYQHTNNRIGVLLTLLAPSEQAAKDSAFLELGNDLAMQIAAMNPLAVSQDRLDADVVERQKGIFETQLTELNKPQAAWPKILEGKFNKWHTEVCLLKQESIVQQKTSVEQVVNNVGTKLGGEIQVINFVRCQVGEGIEVQKTDLAKEVESLSGVAQNSTFSGQPGTRDVVKD